jgi:uncharacterized RDD family membrane protein YckC
MSASLIRYAIGVVVTLALMLAVTWAFGGDSALQNRGGLWARVFGGDAVNVHQGPIDGRILADQP